MMKEKWIIFDVMGVIFKVQDDTNDLLVPFIKKRNNLISKEYINDIYLDASLGRITSDEFWEKMNLCETGKEKKIYKEYLDTCLTIDEDFIETAKRLKKDYNLAILSNDVSEWSSYLRNKYGINELVEFSVISGDVKCRKPNMDIYDIAVGQMESACALSILIIDRTCY